MRPSRASHYNRNPDNLPSRRYQKDTFLSGLAYDFSRLATRRLYGRFNFRRLPHLVIYAGTLGNLGESHIVQGTTLLFRERLYLSSTALAKQGDVTLICWCTPQPCHIEVIRRSVEYLNAIESGPSTPA